MDWRHVIMAIIVLAIGIYIGAKKPGLVSTVTGGAISV